MSLNVNLTMLNPGPNFLDAGDSVLPGVYMLMLGSVLYVMLSMAVEVPHFLAICSSVCCLPVDMAGYLPVPGNLGCQT